MSTNWKNAMTITTYFRNIQWKTSVAEGMTYLL